ncbi:Protein F09A5.2 [Aphelenchoides avenae]|nr:Protein F09A5.2 [Aphelenchus avenae]
MRNVPAGLFLLTVSGVLLIEAVRFNVYDGLRQTGESEVVDTDGRCEPIKVLVGRVRSVDTFERLQPGYSALADRCVDRGDLSSCSFDRKAMSAQDCVVHQTLPEARVTFTVYDELHHTGDSEEVSLSGDCAPIKMYDRASSLESGGKCVMLCDHPGCHGRCVRVDKACDTTSSDCCSDPENLGSCNFSDQAASAKACPTPRSAVKTSDSHQPYRSRHPGRVMVYAGLCHTGDSEEIEVFQGCVSIKMSITFNPYPTNRILSVDTGGKCVMLCENAGCRGRCVKLHPDCISPTECCPDPSDLSSCDFNDRASSARECTLQETVPMTSVSTPTTVTHVPTTTSAYRHISSLSATSKRPRTNKPTTIRPSSTSTSEPVPTTTADATVDHLHYYRSMTSYLIAGAAVCVCILCILMAFFVFTRVRRPPKKDLYEIDSKDVIILKDSRLGSGGFASVFKGICKTDALQKQTAGTPHSSIFAETIVEVAVKVTHAHLSSGIRKEVVREIEVMKALSHNPHVLRLVAFVGAHGTTPMLVLEYCANGNLQAFLQARMSNAKRTAVEANESPAHIVYLDTNVTLRDLISFCWQISDGMVFVASKGFVHRDLAARNVLVTNSLMLKIADFGLCRYSNDALYTAHLDSKLPIKWMALESLERAEFTTKSDVWSFGVLMYEIFSAGAIPYRDKHPTELSGFLSAGKRLDQPELCPTEM